MAFLQRQMNRGSVSTGFNIDNSCVFVDTDRSSTGNGANSHLHFTPSSTGNRKVGTFSAWVKRSHIDSIDAIFSSGQNDQHFRFQTTGINIRDYNESTQLQTNAIYRDTAAFYHFVMAVDTTQGTAANRLKLYVNGDQVTSFSTETYPTQNQDWNFNYTGNKMFIGARRWYNDDVIQGLDGYMADVYWIDGQQLAATDFGEYDDDSGIWKPKAYSGTFGTNGCYLKFDDSSSLGADSSGNGNDWTEVNIAAANQSTDTPTNNFCTLLGQQQDAVTGTEPSIKEGGTTMFGGSTSSQNAVGTMGLRSGKWYFESTITNSGGVDTDNHNFGVVAADQITALSTGGGNDLGYVSGGWAMSSNAAARNNNGYASGYNATSALAVDEIMGVAIDMDNGKIWWHREGTWTSLNSTVGNPANGTTPSFSNLLTATDEPLLPAGGFYINNNDQVRVMNFGGYAQAVFTAVGTYADANGYGSFAYQPPTGFYAICGKNLAEYGGTA
jgi:hypothetical protein